MKSKYRFWAYILIFLTLGFSVILIMEISGKMLNPNMPIGFFIIFTLFFLYVWIWLVFGELRTKVIYVDFKVDRSLVVKRYFGLGPSKIYYLEDFQGYKTSILSSGSGSYEYIYLIIENRKIIKISEYYHSNYKELKKYIISQNLKYLGFENYGLIKELKEMFSY
jgi:hypothetical protein